MLGRLAVAALLMMAGVSNASADWIEWQVASGGNGHYYQAVLVPSYISWTDAESASEAAGGYLATFSGGDKASSGNWGRLRTNAGSV